MKCYAASPAAGLSEADIDYYIPASPIEAVIAWSDSGHGSSTPATSIPTKSSTAHRHVRGVSMGGSSTNAFDETPEHALSTSSPSFPSSSFPTSPASPPSSSKRSSFVVLRGARGDAALTERRVVSNPRRLSAASLGSGHRNSLTSFIESDAEALGNGDEEMIPEVSVDSSSIHSVSLKSTILR